MFEIELDLLPLAGDLVLSVGTDLIKSVYVPSNKLHTYYITKHDIHTFLVLYTIMNAKETLSVCYLLPLNQLN